MKKADKNNPSAPATGAASHHPYGPSKWPALLECPCFTSRPATADTKLGVKLHALFESVLRGSSDAEPADTMEAHVVQMARKLLRAVNPSWGIYIEEGVTLPDLDGRDSGIHGRLDLGWVDAEARAVHIIDLKFCRHPDRSHRSQGLCYAMGLAHRLGFVPELVVLHFAFADSGEVTQEVLSFKEASDEYAANYRRIAEIARGEGSTAPRQCGWCSLCRHHESCSAPRAVAEYVAETLADAPDRWPEFSPARKAQLCVLADAVIRWGEAIEDHAGDDAKNGLLIEDLANGIAYGVQERKGRLVISDVQCAWEVLRPYLTVEGYRGCLSLNQTELKAALKQTGMKLADVNALVEQCGRRLPSTMVFVRKPA